MEHLIKGSKMSVEDRKHGPHFMRLVFHKVARDVVPDGGGVGDVVAFFCARRSERATLMRNAFMWCEHVIDAIRSAPDNPYGDGEEEIAAAILARIEERLV